jgi:hypothetical protein
MLRQCRATDLVATQPVSFWMVSISHMRQAFGRRSKLLTYIDDQNNPESLQRIEMDPSLPASPKSPPSMLDDDETATVRQEEDTSWKKAPAANNRSLQPSGLVAATLHMMYLADFTSTAENTGIYQLHPKAQLFLLTSPTLTN